MESRGQWLSLFILQLYACDTHSQEKYHNFLFFKFYWNPTRQIQFDPRMHFRVNAAILNCYFFVEIVVVWQKCQSKLLGQKWQFLLTAKATELTFLLVALSFFFVSSCVAKYLLDFSCLHVWFIFGINSVIWPTFELKNDVCCWQAVVVQKSLWFKSSK